MRTPSQYPLATAVLVLTLALLAGCGSGDQSCTPGTDGCPCLVGGLCALGLECSNGSCVTSVCDAGELNCPCTSEGACDDGLMCVENTCKEQTCETGTEDCACFGNASCLAPYVCDEGICTLSPECISGESGCPCRTDGTCEPGLSCESDLCLDASTSCVPGAEGCPCLDNKCGASELGGQMECAGGLCQPVACPLGTSGCPCREKTECDDGATCQGGTCVAPGCLPGDAGCGCAGGSCSPGLVCNDSLVCVDATGLMGGPCYDNSTCALGFRCDSNTCLPCSLGSKDCGCKAGGACTGSLVCWDGLCRTSEELGDLPPDSPKCFTPCSSDLVLPDGSFKPCAADGLMDGCFGGLTCNDGTCVLAGQPKPGCDGDEQCPVFQACIYGKCYSNCDTNDECGINRSCYKRVCRSLCTVSGAECEYNYSCVADDGVVGVCLPVVETTGTPHNEVQGSFLLSVTGLEFSNVATTAEVTITNLGPTHETFTVRKRVHQEYNTDGAFEEYDDPWDDGVDCNPAMDCPLYWMNMGPYGSINPVQEVKVQVEGNGGEVTVYLDEAGNGPTARWTGRIEVVHPKYGIQSVALAYAERPEGRWGGHFYYFANFGDKELSAWAATSETKKSQALVDKVNNAFIQRWFAFRSGNISWEEFLAVTTATRIESWRWPSVVADCQEQDGACYPYEINEKGIVTYSSDLATKPVPSGVVELPFAMDIYAPDPVLNPAVMSGRIVTDLALQYPGDPAVSLTLGADPADCQKQTGGVCLVFVDQMQARIDLGGRYLTDSADSTCGQEEGGVQPCADSLDTPGFRAPDRVGS